MTLLATPWAMVAHSVKDHSDQWGGECDGREVACEMMVRFAEKARVPVCSHSQHSQHVHVK